LSGLLCAFSLLAKHASHPPMSYLLLMDDNGKQIRFSIVFLSFFAIMLARAGVEFGQDMLRALPVVVVVSILAIIYTMTATYYRKGQTSEQIVLPAADMDFASQVETALDNHQFYMVYQPQVDFNTGKLKGVEALVRWRHPEKGIISPDKFIHMAELTGLIVPLGKWVMRTACTQACTVESSSGTGQGRDCSECFCAAITVRDTGGRYFADTQRNRTAAAQTGG
jgi:hypothetical protein